jgi:hypothetical protein
MLKSLTITAVCVSLLDQLYFVSLILTYSSSYNEQVVLPTHSSPPKFLLLVRWISAEP